MTESLPLSRDIDRMRKELEKVTEQLKEVRDNVDKVGKNVKEVDRKVDRSNATQLGALATALVGDEEVRREAVLFATGMSVADIAKALGKTENAVRVHLSRAGLLTKRKKGSRGG